MLSKPPGLEDASHGTSVLRAARDQFGQGARPELLTRLERHASGLVVVAEHGRVAAKFRKPLSPSKAPRFFLAVVEGTPPSETGTVNARLRMGTHGVVECVPEGEPTEGSRTAISHYRLLGSGNGLSLLRIRGETDEEGQTRAHLASIGCPIVGDRSNSSSRDDLGRLGLHLGELAFDPPGKFETIRLKAPAPSEFWSVCGLEPPEHARPAEAALAPKAEDQPREAPKTDDEGWEHVAGWYDELVSERRSDHHDRVVHPGVIRMLDPRPGERILDVACGQGELCRLLASQRLEGGEVGVVGVDASPSLIEAARERSPERLSFEVGDAQRLAAGLGEFDGACCVLALMNIEDLDGAMRSVGDRLRAGGRFVGVVMHPAFRVTGASDWDYDDRGGVPVQYRRVGAYLSDRSDEIVMNPGGVSDGARPVVTRTHHRPIGRYVRSCAQAGLLVDSVEEWISTRTSQPGPRAEAENTARREIPLFLAFRAVKANR
ncbi:MAG: methyltransferase domain-containing protein [Phycisphaerales bacterium JB040]